MLRYAITSRQLFAGDEGARRAALVRQAGELRAEGVEWLLLREKDLPAGELAELGRGLLAALGHGQTRLLVGGRAEVALAIGAAGVHLPSAAGELQPADVRELFRRGGAPEPVVSVSCHTDADLRRARDGGANLALFGPVFGKEVDGVQVSEAVGLPRLREACALASPLPVLALGGVTEAAIPLCLQAGAAGVAGIRLFSRSGLPRVRK